jgi:3-oxoadipate enol-lactonase/4-carboxymuconolactone decarboxylase
MPFLTIGGTRLFFRLEGNAELPPLVLSHSIGLDHGMWEPQIPALLPYLHILRYDLRGHGASDVPQGEYSIECLGRDTLELIDQLKIGRFAFCGLSLGGAVGQWLARHVPERLTHLVLANTSARFGPAANWERRIEMVEQGGMAAIADMAMQRFFSSKSAADANVYAAHARSVLLGTNPAGYIGCCAALRDFDGIDHLDGLSTPTLVIAGDRDISTPWTGHGEILATRIEGAQGLRLPAAHLSNLECPNSFAAALIRVLRPELARPEDCSRQGEPLRRSVLGDKHVNHAQAETTEFNRDFQELITRFAWGTVWSRPGLDIKTRRLLALAMLATLGHWEEFRLHVRSGLARELEDCDLKEVLLELAVYAGIPAANSAFRIAQEEIAKHENFP